MSTADLALLEQLKQLREELEELKRQREHQEPTPVTQQESVVTKELSGDTRHEREMFAEELPVPGRDAPTFNLVNDFLSIGVIPWGDPLVPAYLLDKHYRIVDWNTAFGMAFDHTMDGRRGMSVLEWVYFLDNYEESLTKSAHDFADPENLPRLHLETIRYTSPRYGEIVAEKRAYQVPGDDGELIGWLVTMDAKMSDPSITLRYKRDLFAALRNEMTWSEYALSYDVVLLASKVYPELLRHILGEHVPAGGNGRLAPIRDGARVLDLGAGTGNVSRLLAEQNRGHVIFAVENNRGMLDLLQAKCKSHLRQNDEGPGILAIKQDVTALFGLPEESFDCAILNNVAYALEDPLACFRQVRQALRANGEIRISGPKKSTDLNVLFARIAADLEDVDRMAELRDDFDRVRDINANALKPILYRWDTDGMADLLRTAGFSKIAYTTDSAYAGQAMIVAARV